MAFFVLCGCETWSPTLKGKVRLRGFQITVLRKMFEPKRDKFTRKCRKLHTYDLHNYKPYQNYPSDRTKGNEFCELYGCYWYERNGCAVWWGTLKEGGHGEDVDLDEIKRLKLMFKKLHGRVWNGFIRLRVGTSGRLS